MNRNFIIICLLLATTALAAQETTQLSPFEELILKGKIEVIIEEGPENTLTIEDTDFPEDELNIIRQGNTLKLTLIDGWWKDERFLRLRIQYNSLSKVKATAGAIVSNRGTLTGNSLEVKAGSGAELRLNIDVTTLEAAAVEGAVLELTGQAEIQYASAATGGEYDGADLSCGATEVKANTGGVAYVVANNSLRANANTGGTVRYSGNPDEKYTKSNLAGEIRRM